MSAPEIRHCRQRTLPVRPLPSDPPLASSRITAAAAPSTSNIAPSSRRSDATSQMTVRTFSASLSSAWPCRSISRLGRPFAERGQEHPALQDEQGRRTGARQASKERLEDVELPTARRPGADRRGPWPRVSPAPAGPPVGGLARLLPEGAIAPVQGPLSPVGVLVAQVRQHGEDAAIVVVGLL